MARSGPLRVVFGEPALERDLLEDAAGRGEPHRSGQAVADELGARFPGHSEHVPSAVDGAGHFGTVLVDPRAADTDQPGSSVNLSMPAILIYGTDNPP